MLAARVALACALLASGCNHEASTAKSIAGRWTSEPWPGQSGPVRTTICFSPDGTYALTDSPAAPEVNRGTYSIAGNSVTFRWAGGHETEQMRWEGNVLVLTTGDRAVTENLARRFHRNPGSCD